MCTAPLRETRVGKKLEVGTELLTAPGCHGLNAKSLVACQPSPPVTSHKHQSGNSSCQNTVAGPYLCAHNVLPCIHTLVVVVVVGGHLRPYDASSAGGHLNANSCAAAAVSDSRLAQLPLVALPAGLPLYDLAGFDRYAMRVLPTEHVYSMIVLKFAVLDPRSHLKSARRMYSTCRHVSLGCLGSNAASSGWYWQTIRTCYLPLC